MKDPLKIPVSMKNRTAVGAVIIIVAIVFGFVLVPLVSKASSPSISVVRAKSNIPIGTKITAGMLETVQAGKKGLPDNVLHSISEAAGKYAAVGITAQDDITKAKISAEGGMYDLSDGQLLISVAVKNFADSLSGKIQAGDIVSVYFPVSSNSVTGAAADAQCPPELQYVKVAAVTTAKGGDTDETQVQKQASSNSTDSLPAAVTLIVNSRQAQLIAGQESGAVHLALACRADPERARRLLKKQDEYFHTASAAASAAASSAANTSSQSSESAKPDASSQGLDTSDGLGAVK